jgi:NTE family protein
MKRFTKMTRSELEVLRIDLLDLKDDPDFNISGGDENVCDLVFAGGGAKGISHLGAIWALDQLGVRFKRVAGNSAGAITASFVAAGYSPTELIDTLFDVDLMDLRDGKWDTYFPKIALMMAVANSYGMYDGAKLKVWIEEMLLKKGATTFGSLPRESTGLLSELNEEDGSRLTMVASDVTCAHGVILPDDLATEKYGYLNKADFPISSAVRMSISVPFFFTPVKLHNSLIVDGAFSSNLPLEIFDKEDPEQVRWPTLGINLTSNPSPPHHTDDILNFGLAIFDTMRYGQSQMSFLNYPTRICRIIDIRTDEVKTLDFNLTREQKERLFVNGVKAVLETLKGENGKGIRQTWNFEQYMILRRRFSFYEDKSRSYFEEESGETGGGGT